MAGAASVRKQKVNAIAIMPQIRHALSRAVAQTAFQTTSDNPFSLTACIAT